MAKNKKLITVTISDIFLDKYLELRKDGISPSAIMEAGINIRYERLLKSLLNNIDNV